MTKFTLSPKQQASKLVKKFHNRVNLDIEASIQCALIAVDQIIKFSSFKDESENKDFLKYWEKVKAQIINFD